MTTRPARRTAAAFTALGALVALSACGSDVADAGADSAAAALTIENCGREITVDGPPQAIVGLSPTQTELLIRLGLADRIVGQAQTATAPLSEDIADQAADIPVLSEDAPPTREVLLDAEPDFVYAPTDYEFTAEQGFASHEQLAEADVAAYTATGGCPDRRMEGTVSDLFTDLSNLGAVFEVEEAAEALAADAEATLQDVHARTEGLEPPTVAQVYVEGEALTAIGAGIEYDIIRQAGGENVFGPDDPEFASFFAAQINPEALAAADPEVIVFAVNGPEHEAATRDYLQRTLPEVSAVANDRLVVISSSDVYPGSLGNIDAVAAVAAGLYPEAFGA
ncbi:ABC transporter substrate-binding protein [Glycomyces sp. TRM65418]|uniref:ABC transporter substrate-binding protein n=1 Tax=Glycomyces sp. TRM65418 TaxID=2867006 RepID=UPI001CE59F44|nr:ABC transporter substrate-binding protein [Glycomyces sp. TRM65418]MCC3764632.1 ABC transporter substrate-binding protein [Glycomyces sp. TRM65418]QZD54295.1 ABC transporter substrate-binding protein [Glycomyces sp. TRM65418]